MREAVAGCHAEGLPLILEPIVYALPDETPRGLRGGLPLARGGSRRPAPAGARARHPQGAVPARRSRRRGGLVQATRRRLRADAVGAAGRRRRARGVRPRPAHRLRRRRLGLHRGPHALDGRDRRRRRGRDLASPRRRAAAALPARHRAERPAVARARRRAGRAAARLVRLHSRAGSGRSRPVAGWRTPGGFELGQAASFRYNPMVEVLGVKSKATLAGQQAPPRPGSATVT